MKKLVFFFPWSEVSGGPYFLSRLANEAAKLGLYEVFYTDYYHGLCESLLEEKSIKILRYNNEGAEFEIFPDEPVTLVMAEYWAHMVPKLHPQSKIVFFNWHNECIPVLKRDWCASDSYIDKFLRLVKETSSVFFCDKTHWLAHNRNSISANEIYVPITVPQRKGVASTKVIKDGERNIAVLGRLCQDKVYAVLDLLDNIVGLRDRIKTRVFIIGDGDQADLVFKRKYPAHIELVKCGTMDLDKALSLMLRKTDVLFAMGTSVLEGASIHLPAAVLPNAMEPFECNHYPYLYESTGYALGWYPDQIEDLGIITHSLEEIFDDIYGKGKKGEIGQKCYDYYINNHQGNIDQFLKAIDASTLTAGKYKEFVKRNINWKNIWWHIKNRLRKWYGYRQRSFSVLGFPVYVHTKLNDICSNIYICCIPLLRIYNIYGAVKIYILPLVWVKRIVQKVVRCFINLCPFRKDAARKQ